MVNVLRKSEPFSKISTTGRHYAELFNVRLSERYEG